jgi:heptosyltransferase-2
MPFSALIVKLAAIGDVAMALPMVTALRAKHPGCRITWLCGESAQPLLACVSGIDRLVVANERALLAGSRRDQTAETLRVWTRLGVEHFDLVLTAHADRRYRLLTLLARAVRRRSLADARPRARIVNGRYHGDEYVRMVTDLDDYRAESFAIPPLAAELPPHIRTALLTGNPDRRPLIALAPGGARNVLRESPLRRWPLENYAALAGLLRQHGYATVLTGSETDSWTRSALQPDSIDLVGRTNLPELIALFRECAAVVAHDSGPLHLARLAGVPRVALFGPTDPGTFIGPRTRVAVLWPGSILPCAPCYDGREFAACSNNLCMQHITPEAALQALIDLIAADAIGKA